MEKIKAISIALTLTLLVSLPSNAYCSSYWDDFLKQPDEETLTLLQNAMAASAQRCSGDIAPVQEQRSRFFELISSGNQLAFRAALRVSRCWDGGELEDFYSSVGLFFEKHPRIFLQIVDENAIPDQELMSMFTMLPQETTDNIELAISVTENRIAILKEISDESFFEIKTSGLFYLEKLKRSLIRTKIELDKAK